MLPDKDIGCHRTGFTKTCFDCVVTHRCQLWQQIIGMDKNTGEHLNSWGCSDAFTNKLIVENTSETRQSTASTDRLNNDIVAMSGVSSVRASILARDASPLLIENEK